MIKLTLSNGHAAYFHFDAISVMVGKDDGSDIFAGNHCFPVQERVQDIVLEMAQFAVDAVCEENGVEEMTRN